MPTDDYEDDYEDDYDLDYENDYDYDNPYWDELDSYTNDDNEHDDNEHDDFLDDYACGVNSKLICKACKEGTGECEYVTSARNATY